MLAGEADSSGVELLEVLEPLDSVDFELLAFVLEDFFGEEEGEASALLEEDFFVLEEVLPLVPVFLVLALEAVEPDDFFFAVELDEVLELVVDSFLFAHAVTNASAANTVIRVRAVFFIAMG